MCELPRIERFNAFKEIHFVVSHDCSFAQGIEMPPKPILDSGTNCDGLNDSYYLCELLATANSPMFQQRHSRWRQQAMHRLYRVPSSTFGEPTREYYW